MSSLTFVLAICLYWSLAIGAIVVYILSNPRVLGITLNWLVRRVLEYAALETEARITCQRVNWRLQRPRWNASKTGKYRNLLISIDGLSIDINRTAWARASALQQPAGRSSVNTTIRRTFLDALLQRAYTASDNAVGAVKFVYVPYLLEAVLPWGQILVQPVSSTLSLIERWLQFTICINSWGLQLIDDDELIEMAGDSAKIDLKSGQNTAISIWKHTGPAELRKSVSKLYNRPDDIALSHPFIVEQTEDSALQMTYAVTVDLSSHDSMSESGLRVVHRRLDTALQRPFCSELTLHQLAVSVGIVVKAVPGIGGMIADISSRSAMSVGVSLQIEVDKPVFTLHKDDVYPISETSLVLKEDIYADSRTISTVSGFVLKRALGVALEVSRSVSSGVCVRKVPALFAAELDVFVSSPLVSFPIMQGDPSHVVLQMHDAHCALTLLPCHSRGTTVTEGPLADAIHTSSHFPLSLLFGTVGTQDIRLQHGMASSVSIAALTLRGAQSFSSTSTRWLLETTPTNALASTTAIDIDISSCDVRLSQIALCQLLAFVRGARRRELVQEEASLLEDSVGEIASLHTWRLSVSMRHLDARVVDDGLVAVEPAGEPPFIQCKLHRLQLDASLQGLDHLYMRRHSDSLLDVRLYSVGDILHNLRMTASSAVFALPAYGPMPSEAESPTLPQLVPTGENREPLLLQDLVLVCTNSSIENTAFVGTLEVGAACWELDENHLPAVGMTAASFLQQCIACMPSLANMLFPHFFQHLSPFASLLPCKRSLRDGLWHNPASCSCAGSAAEASEPLDSQTDVPLFAVLVKEVFAIHTSSWLLGNQSDAPIYVVAASDVSFAILRAEQPGFSRDCIPHVHLSDTNTVPIPWRLTTGHVELRSTHALARNPFMNASTLLDTLHRSTWATHCAVDGFEVRETSFPVVEVLAPTSPAWQKLLDITAEKVNVKWDSKIFVHFMRSVHEITFSAWHMLHVVRRAAAVCAFHEEEQPLAAAAEIMNPPLDDADTFITLLSSFLPNGIGCVDTTGSGLKRLTIKNIEVVACLTRLENTIAVSSSAPEAALVVNVRSFSSSSLPQHFECDMLTTSTRRGSMVTVPHLSVSSRNSRTGLPWGYMMENLLSRSQHMTGTLDEILPPAVQRDADYFKAVLAGKHELHIQAKSPMFVLGHNEKLDDVIDITMAHASYVMNALTESNFSWYPQGPEHESLFICNCVDLPPPDVLFQASNSLVALKEPTLDTWLECFQPLWAQFLNDTATAGELGLSNPAIGATHLLDDSRRLQAYFKSCSMGQAVSMRCTNLHLSLRSPYLLNWVFDLSASGTSVQLRQHPLPLLRMPSLSGSVTLSKNADEKYSVDGRILASSSELVVSPGSVFAAIGVLELFCKLVAAHFVASQLDKLLGAVGEFVAGLHDAKFSLQSKELSMLLSPSTNVYDIKPQEGFCLSLQSIVYEYDFQRSCLSWRYGGVAINASGTQGGRLVHVVSIPLVVGKYCSDGIVSDCGSVIDAAIARQEGSSFGASIVISPPLFLQALATVTSIHHITRFPLRGLAVFQRWKSTMPVPQNSHVLGWWKPRRLRIIARTEAAIHVRVLESIASPQSLTLSIVDGLSFQGTISGEPAVPDAFQTGKVVLPQSVITLLSNYQQLSSILTDESPIRVISDITAIVPTILLSFTGYDGAANRMVSHDTIFCLQGARLKQSRGVVDNTAGVMAPLFEATILPLEIRVPWHILPNIMSFGMRLQEMGFLGIFWNSILNVRPIPGEGSLEALQVIQTDDAMAASDGSGLKHWFSISFLGLLAGILDNGSSKWDLCLSFREAILSGESAEAGGMERLKIGLSGIFLVFENGIGQSSPLRSCPAPSDLPFSSGLRPCLFSVKGPCDCVHSHELSDSQCGSTILAPVDIDVVMVVSNRRRQYADLLKAARSAGLSAQPMVAPGSKVSTLQLFIAVDGISLQISPAQFRSMLTISNALERVLSGFRKPGVEHLHLDPLSNINGLNALRAFVKDKMHFADIVRRRVQHLLRHIAYLHERFPLLSEVSRISRLLNGVEATDFIFFRDHDDAGHVMEATLLHAAGQRNQAVLVSNPLFLKSPVASFETVPLPRMEHRAHALWYRYADSVLVVGNDSFSGSAPHGGWTEIYKSVEVSLLSAVRMLHVLSCQIQWAQAGILRQELAASAANVDVDMFIGGLTLSLRSLASQLSSPTSRDDVSLLAMMAGASFRAILFGGRTGSVVLSVNDIKMQDLRPQAAFGIVAEVWRDHETFRGRSKATLIASPKAAHDALISDTVFSSGVHPGILSEIGVLGHSTVDSGSSGSKPRLSAIDASRSMAAYFSNQALVQFGKRRPRTGTGAILEEHEGDEDDPDVSTKISVMTVTMHLTENPYKADDIIVNHMEITLEPVRLNIALALINELTVEFGSDGVDVAGPPAEMYVDIRKSVEERCYRWAAQTHAALPSHASPVAALCMSPGTGPHLDPEDAPAMLSTETVPQIDARGRIIGETPISGVSTVAMDEPQSFALTHLLISALLAGMVDDTVDGRWVCPDPTPPMSEAEVSACLSQWCAQVVASPTIALQLDASAFRKYVGGYHADVTDREDRFSARRTPILFKYVRIGEIQACVAFRGNIGGIDNLDNIVVKLHTRVYHSERTPVLALLTRLRNDIVIDVLRQPARNLRNIGVFIATKLRIPVGASRQRELGSETEAVRPSDIPPQSSLLEPVVTEADNDGLALLGEGLMPSSPAGEQRSAASPIMRMFKRKAYFVDPIQAAARARSKTSTSDR